MLYILVAIDESLRYLFFKWYIFVRYLLCGCRHVYGWINEMPLPCTCRLTRISLNQTKTAFN